MSGKRPVFVMIAGPNGSGKSSITKELQEIQSDFPTHYINADEIKKALLAKGGLKRLDIVICSYE